jgi:hypothetical protein
MKAIPETKLMKGYFSRIAFISYFSGIAFISYVSGIAFIR